MTDKTPDQVTCSSCHSSNVRVVSQKNNLRPRLHTGNIHTDLTPISVTVTYKCQGEGCGKEWSTTTAQ